MAFVYFLIDVLMIFLFQCVSFLNNRDATLWSHSHKENTNGLHSMTIHSNRFITGDLYQNSHIMCA